MKKVMLIDLFTVLDRLTDLSEQAEPRRLRFAAKFSDARSPFGQILTRVFCRPDTA